VGFSTKGLFVKKVITIFAFILMISGCSKPQFEQTLKISTTTWIGYTPLYYAKEKGWLDDINVKLVNAVSLSENMYLYQAGNSDAFCGTQYEYSVLKKQNPNTIPIMLFDRSNGGDLIMSNHRIEELQNSTKKIQTYLEMDSINFTLLNDFINTYNIDENRIQFINRDQVEISSLTNSTPEEHIVIITYIPFDILLEKNGFKEILSTKSGLDLLVIDGLYAPKETFVKHEKQFKALKTLSNEAIAVLHSNPKEFYQTVKPYLETLTYQEFNNSLEDIIWINKELPEQLKSRMRQASFPIKDIL